MRLAAPFVVSELSLDVSKCNSRNLLFSIKKPSPIARTRLPDGGVIRISERSENGIWQISWISIGFVGGEYLVGTQLPVLRFGLPLRA